MTLPFVSDYVSTLLFKEVIIPFKFLSEFKDDIMKINALLMFMAAMNVTCIARIAKNDSKTSRAIHELHKNCIQCHAGNLKQISKDKPQLVAPVPKLCYGCHKDYLSMGEWVHGPVATGECLLCHDPHKTNIVSMLSKSMPELCCQCHEMAMLRPITNHLKKSYSQCGVCHTGHISQIRMRLKNEFFKTDAGKNYIRNNPSSQPVGGHHSPVDESNGIKVVMVIVEPNLLSRYGFTEDGLCKKVEMQLRRNGIRILDKKELLAGQSCLYVELRLMKVLFQNRSEKLEAMSGSLNMFLRQKIELVGRADNGQQRYNLLTTWDANENVIWKSTQIEAGFNESAKKLIEMLTKNYLNYNLGN